MDRFGFQPPKRMYNVFTQVKDLDFDTPPILDTGVTVSRAWNEFQKYPNIASLPVTREDGTLYGILSRTDIASYNMSGIHSGVLEDVPLFNLLSVLEGKALNDAGDNIDTIAGEVVIALPQAQENLLFHDRKTVVLCGHQPEMIRRAMEMNVSCLVLCQAELPDDLRQISTQTCVIATPLDAYRAARLMFQATPVGRICNRQGLVCFHLEDRVDHIKEQVLKYRHPSYPILDEQERAVGILTRYHLLRPKRKKIVLVDHNEASQSVPGLEEAEILEIIDHHRLADIQTSNPIYVRNEPVGSTNTIIAGMFQDRGLMPSAKMAGMMASAILSDTVMFKSPTCTTRDIRMAERMARIANVSLEELGQRIFSASWSDDKTAKELLFSDFKEFHIAGYSLGVGQITCVNSEHILKRKFEFIMEMQAAVDKRKYDMVLLMLTDVLLEGTQLLYLGDEDIIRAAFSPDAKNHSVFLPKVMSRKKQIIPALSAMWG